MVTLAAIGSWAGKLVLAFLWSKLAALITGILAGFAARHALQDKFKQVDQADKLSVEPLKQAVADSAKATTPAETDAAAKEMDDAIDNASEHF